MDNNKLLKNNKLDISNFFKNLKNKISSSKLNSSSKPNSLNDSKVINRSNSSYFSADNKNNLMKSRSKSLVLSQCSQYFSEETINELAEALTAPNVSFKEVLDSENLVQEIKRTGIESIYFSAKENASLDSQLINMDKSKYNILKKCYIQLIKNNNVGNDANALISYIEKLNFNPELSLVDIEYYSAYSKDNKRMNHNISGDFSFSIKHEDYNINFVFSAANVLKISNPDYWQLRSILNSIPRSIKIDAIAIAIHAKIIFTLIALSQDNNLELFVNTKDKNINSKFISLLSKASYAFTILSKENEYIKIYAKGGCNILFENAKERFILNFNAITQHHVQIDDFETIKKIDYNEEEYVDNLNNILEINQKDYDLILLTNKWFEKFYNFKQLNEAMLQLHRNKQITQSSLELKDDYDMPYPVKYSSKSNNDAFLL